MADGVPSRRPLRVVLFTDTLADVNGVSRFIRDIAQQALQTGRDLTVVTSTRLPCQGAANIINLTPRLARSMPGYADLELVSPPIARAREIVARLRPDVVHISTPGPVGVAGLLAARRHRIPVLGTYHTDYPAYIEHLFADAALTWLAGGAMRLFYRRFARIFTRSADYARSLSALGIHCRHITRLRPGTDTEVFHPRFRDQSIWEQLGCAADTVKVLVCGRISVEKNLPMLAGVWRAVESRLSTGPAGVRAELILVGDGPYRHQMEQELAGTRSHFLGFRHGPQLSALYASSDLFLFPSMTDTLGQAAMEAQASGIPVLVSDRGGPREMVRHNRTGLILPGTRPSAWTDAITTLILDPPRRRDMGAAAHTAMQQHSIRDSFNHWWTVHEQAFAAESTPAR